MTTTQKPAHSQKLAEITKKRNDAVRHRFSELFAHYSREGIRPVLKDVMQKVADEFFISLLTVSRILKKG